MGEILPNNTGLCFGIHNSQDLFRKLQHDAKRLREEWSTYDAFNFVVTAWHLYHDWVKSDPPKAMSRSKRKKKHLPPSMILILDLSRDIANGSKHFQLDKDASKNRKVGRLHSGRESNWYSFFFYENLLGVTTDDACHYFPIRVLHNVLMAYFYWVFDDTTPVKKFPQDIDEGIRYGNISSREDFKKVPKLWLLHSEQRGEARP